MSEDDQPQRAWIWRTAHGVAAMMLVVLACALFMGLPARAGADICPWPAQPFLVQQAPVSADR